MDIAPDSDSRVTTPSSPGSTSGESLTLDDSIDEGQSMTRQDERVPNTQQRASSSTMSDSGNSGSTSRHSTTAPPSASASTIVDNGTSSTSLSSRRRHLHHQHHHSLTLGTGAAKMGSSITDSAQSTEDEMYDDEEDDEEGALREDDRPRVLYPALATPKAAGNNFWPFGTMSEGPANGDEVPDPVAGASSSMDDGLGLHDIRENHKREGTSHGSLSAQPHVTFRQPPTDISDNSSSVISNSSLALTESASTTSTSLAVYRSQVHAPSGANAAFLPHEILLKILRNVRSTEDLVSSLQVCKSWCQCGVELLWNKPLFPHVGPLIKMLVILSRSNTTTFKYANFIKRLNFSQLADKMSDALLIRLAVCSRLERLTLAGCLEITNSSLISLLDNCKNLVALDLSDCAKITDETVIAAAKNCKRLQGLNLSGCKLVTDEGVKAIAKGCPLLRRVKLRNLETLTDDAVIALVLSCPLLLEVDLYACTSMTDRTLWALFRNSSHLRELSLNNCTQVTGDGFPQRDGKLVYIKGSDDPALVGLKPLNHKLANLSIKIQDPNTSLSVFQALPANTTLLSSRLFDHVRYLDLTGMINLTDTAMAGIVVTMPHIRNLVLAKCSSLSDESVMSICRLGKHIHFLHLGHVSHITDKSVTTLARACTRLRYIDLACCPNLTDLSVFELAANLPRLKRIGLVRVSSLTDQAIFALAERTTLERIHLSYCEHVSVSAVQFLLSRLNRLNHLSLTGVPAFRRADLQHFCRPPPKDFNPHQRSTFCVYSGKGVHELRKHLLSLQQSEFLNGGGGNGGMHNTLIPQGFQQGNQYANHQLHLQHQHQQFAQLQLGLQMQQHSGNPQHLPTYPHLFQNHAGHAVISQIPLQAQGQGGDDGDDVDEDVDEEDDDNGDDEADEDGSAADGLSMGARRQQQSHSHGHGSSSHVHQPSSAHQSNSQSSRTASITHGSTFNPPPYYRSNHRMTGRAGELLDENRASPSSEPAASLQQGIQQPPLAGAFPRYVPSPAARQLSLLLNAGNTSSATAQNTQMAGGAPSGQGRAPHFSLQLATGDADSAPDGRLPFTRPFTPQRGPRSTSPAPDALGIIAGSSETASDSIMDMPQDSIDARQRSHSVEMDLNTEDEARIGTEVSDDGISRGVRSRRDTIMQSTYRQES